MKSKNIVGIACCFLVSGLWISSCSKMDATYDQFLKKGENIYLGRIDSAKIFAGKNRVKFRYWSSDPKSTGLMVYWASRGDSLMTDVPDKLKSDSVDLIIPDLPEGILSFEMIMTNKTLPYKSMPFNTSSRVYGEQYQASLIDRYMKTIEYDNLTKELTIVWYGTIPNAVACELRYADPEGNVTTRMVPSTEGVTVVDRAAKELAYRTLYVPEPTAIDTFYTPFKEVDF